MGVSTNAILCYGVPLDEDQSYSLPWTQEYDDIEEWWREKTGWSLSTRWDEEKGQLVYPEGLTAKGYYDLRNKHDARNPCPAEVVYHCSGSFPMYIIAVPGSVKVAWRGDVEEIDPGWINNFASDHHAREVIKFDDFIKNYNISQERPRWCLVSYWG